MDKHSEDSKPERRPSPDDFDLYLPWACGQLQMEQVVQVIKVYQNEYVSLALTDRSKRGKSRAKLAASRIDLSTELDRDDKSAFGVTQTYDELSSCIIKVHAFYDVCENLVQLKFQKNAFLPRVMLKVIGLILQFQKHLTTISINSGVDSYTIYEISKFLPTTNITDICLSDCNLKEPNYHMLLDTPSFLKYLSLSRCNIDDAVVELICSKLTYPEPASRTLSILDLSSNRITDIGASFIANALRSNRQLSYLNLASNMITDAGAALLFKIFVEFPLTTEEVLASKTRNMTYLQNKNEMITLTIAELRIVDSDKKSGKRKTVAGVKKVKGDTSQKSLGEATNLAEVDSALVAKAISIVEKTLGDFVDPFSISNTFTRQDLTYCKGNNTLCCLNLSYNSLSYLSLRKILSVLLYQKLMNRKPRGLLNVSVEGNSMPIACQELSHIDNILEINLMGHARKLSTFKKRPQLKSNPH